MTTYYLLQMVVYTALIERFGALDGSSYLFHSCYPWISISRKTLVLFFFWSAKVHFPPKFRTQIKKRRKPFSGAGYFMSRWTLSVSMTHLSHSTWLIGDLFSFQGSRFFQAHNVSTTKMPHVLIHGSRWELCGAVWREQGNHGWRTGSKYLTGMRDPWIQELLSLSELC